MASFSAPRLSRRALVGSTLAGAALAQAAPVGRLLAPLSASAAPMTSAVPRRRLDEIAPFGWRTLVLQSAIELRPAAPAAPTQAELDELVALQGQRNDETIATIQQWNGGTAIIPWTELANKAFAEFKQSSLRQSRSNAILHAAMYDAVLAAYDAQDAYKQPAPATLDDQIKPLEGIAADRPSFPSEHAAIAGAAAAVLTALLPDATANRFTDLAEQAALTRLQVGVNTRRDIDAGLALGKAIGERAIAARKDDAPASAWDGKGMPTGPGYWQPTPPAFVKLPLEPLAATWRTWVLESPDQFRPAPPPKFGSSGQKSQLAAVQEAVARRTLEQAREAAYWQGTAASYLWDGFAEPLFARHGLDLPHAARVMAYASIAMADAQIACWDCKYAYWTARPITLDPKLNVLFPTPPFPSYPSAHSTVSNAGAVVLAHFFPDEQNDLLALASQAAASRGWAGIHFPLDNDTGTLLGRQVGALVCQAARDDGAE